MARLVFELTFEETSPLTDSQIADEIMAALDEYGFPDMWLSVRLLQVEKQST